MSVRRRTVAALLAAALVAGCGGDSGGDSGDEPPQDGERAAATATATATAEPEETATAPSREDVVGGLDGFDPQAIYEREAPGVVTVVSLFGGGGLGSILGGDGEEDDGGGLGSGFVISAERGEVVTNAHVVTTGDGADIEEAEEVYVQFGDGNRVPAEVRGYDPNSDTALLTIDPEGLDLVALEWGDSDEVEVGAPVAAMGSPFGEEQSLTVGVVSAVDRAVASLTEFQIAGAIQTDAAINPGNSGGPLVNAAGRVIGVNQQIRSRSGGGEGVGFAVPSNLVKRAVDQLRESGRTDYAYIGVSSQAVYPQAAERFDLPVERGAWVQEVTDGGPAERAGLQGGEGREVRFQATPFLTGGDVIVEVAGREVRDPGDLAEAIALRDPGEAVEVELYRDGERQTVRVRLGRRPLEIADRPG